MRRRLSLEKKIGELVTGMQSHETPGMPKFLKVGPIDDSGKFSVADQKIVLIQN